MVFGFECLCGLVFGFCFALLRFVMLCVLGWRFYGAVFCGFGSIC